MTETLAVLLAIALACLMILGAVIALLTRQVEALQVHPHLVRKHSWKPVRKKRRPRARRFIARGVDSVRGEMMRQFTIAIERDFLHGKH